MLIETCTHLFVFLLSQISLVKVEVSVFVLFPGLLTVVSLRVRAARWLLCGCAGLRDHITDAHDRTLESSSSVSVLVAERAWCSEHTLLFRERSKRYLFPKVM